MFLIGLQACASLARHAPESPSQSQSLNVKSSQLKYPSGTVLLSTSHDYLREANAPDYWALSPYYTAQQTDSACSVATVAMILNAARAGQELKKEDELFTQNKILKILNNSNWSAQVSQGGNGVSLDELRNILLESFHVIGLLKVSVEAVHISQVSHAAEKKLRQALVANEASNKNFMIANFDQGQFTADTSVGHFAPVGAYDAVRKRILIMDPDRQWYEPYWVSEAEFLKAMATQDQDAHQPRGYLFIQLSP